MRYFPVFRLAAACIVGSALAAGLLQAQPSRPAGPGRAGLESPVRIASIDNGPLLVTDYHSQSVCMLNRTSLDILRCFNIEGKPAAVAWSNGRVFVGNETTGSVEVYNPAGKLQSYLGNEQGGIKQPNDIAVDEMSGKIFVVDGNEKNIKVFSLEGALLSVITGTSAGEGRLMNPTGIALDAGRGEVFVSDYGDPSRIFPARVHIFDYAGNYLSGIPGRTGGFSRPQGLAVDEGRIFVADGMLGSVLVFDLAGGAKVKTLGTFGAGPGQLMLPLDVLVDPKTKDVFVTNNRNGRVERFEEGGLMP